MVNLKDSTQSHNGSKGGLDFKNASNMRTKFLEDVFLNVGKYRIPMSDYLSATQKALLFKRAHRADK